MIEKVAGTINMGSYISKDCFYSFFQVNDTCLHALEKYIWKPKCSLHYIYNIGFLLPHFNVSIKSHNTMYMYHFIWDGFFFYFVKNVIKGIRNDPVIKYWCTCLFVKTLYSPIRGFWLYKRLVKSFFIINLIINHSLCIQ